MNYLDEYKKWCESPEFDEETKKELLEIKDNEKEIEDRFYKELEFGTAGLRGVIGAGTNRMNKYTVGKATQGLANYIVEQGTEKQGVAISYDSRKMSKEFSMQTALILNANVIKGSKAKAKIKAIAIALRYSRFTFLPVFCMNTLILYYPQLT